MFILSFFTDNGIPAPGLSPVVKIRDVVDGSLLVSESAMTELGDGFYRFDFVAYDVTGSYAIRSDGGSTLTDSDRFQSSGNESFVDDVWQQPTGSQDVAGTMGADLNFVTRIEGGRWQILTASNQMVFFDEGNTNEIARFNLLDVTGSAGFENPFERVRA